ncbi:hypothetical protein [Paenibacillus ginsengarvi]|uniref:hypothetical protein n=1 Tax=Paenibacillus ginsengarvi TaxID=400777 RepID=UPI001874C619|nr:hypothetical protein [Paenibacillus ginsengarvi]
MHAEEIHILDATLNEIRIENPVSCVEKQVTSRIVINNDKVSVNLEVQDLKSEKVYSRSESGSWNQNIGFGSILKYEINDKKIIAYVSAQASPSTFIGELVVSYISSGPNLKCSQIKFRASDEPK